MSYQVPTDLALEDNPPPAPAMPDVSETLPATAAESSSSSASAGAGAGAGDRRTAMPGTKRLYITLSFVFSFAAALPFLLKTGEIYRSPLPFDSIAALSSRFKSDPPSFLCRFQVILLLSDRKSLDIEQIALAISDDIKRRADGFSSCGGNPSVSVTLDYGSVDSAVFAGDDDAVDEALDAALRSGCEGSGVYTVVVAEREEEGVVRVVVGKHRHAWMVGRVSVADAVSVAGKIFLDYFMNGGRSGGEDGGLREEESRPVGLDGTVVLSFSLLNSNPEDWVYDWEFGKIDTMLAEVVEALSPVANISIESQVLYYTPKSSISYWDNNLGSYISRLSDLPFFVNSNEWHLDTSVAAGGRSKVLQFTVYVPSATECPLLLRLPNGDISKTNGFISPMWGGVVVWNPVNCSKNYPSTARRTISPQDLNKIFQVFIGQLRLLFGFKPDHANPFGSAISSFLPSKNGFTEWELDALYRHYACYNLISSATTLESLSKLVQSLPRMIVIDEIGKQVKLSLDAASLAQKTSSLGIYDASAVSSRKARALAEDAFFHPSIMSISYSSIEHYFAIYMPFFAPVVLHVFLAAVKELKRYMRERSKYLAFVHNQGKDS